MARRSQWLLARLASLDGLEDFDRPAHAVLCPQSLRDASGAVCVAGSGDECTDPFGESIGVQLSLGQRFRAGSELLDLVAPEGLIAQERADQGGAAGAQSGSGCASAAVVHDGRHPRKQPACGARCRW